MWWVIGAIVESAGVILIALAVARHCRHSV
jgi:hypothetical protein